MVNLGIVEELRKFAPPKEFIELMSSRELEEFRQVMEDLYCVKCLSYHKIAEEVRHDVNWVHECIKALELPNPTTKQKKKAREEQKLKQIETWEREAQLGEYERLDNVRVQVRGDGYTSIRIGIGNPWQAEHRLVWEQVHNEKLPKGWLVHHLNEIKSDNMPENLCAAPRKEHSTVGYIVRASAARIRALEAQVTQKNLELENYGNYISELLSRKETK